MANENALLAMLPADDRRRVLAQFDDVPLPKGKVLFEPGEIVHRAYFVTSGLISLMAVTPDDDAIELALVGRDGFIGDPLLATAETMPHRVLVHIAGRAVAIRGVNLQAAFQQSSAVRSVLLHYEHSLHVQVSSAAICRRFHGLRQRLSRWLLSASDRIGADRISVTQETLARIFNTSRQRINTVAVELSVAGAIGYRHGTVVIANRRSLISHACSCYQPLTGHAHKVAG